MSKTRRNNAMTDEEIQENWTELEKEIDGKGKYCVITVRSTLKGVLNPIEIEAKKYFCDCDEAALKLLMMDEWKGTSAKVVALSVAKLCPEFSIFLSHFKGRDLIDAPFRCNVDASSTLVWLRRHRPELIAKLKRDDPSLRIL